MYAPCKEKQLKCRLCHAGKRPLVEGTPRYGFGVDDPQVVVVNHASPLFPFYRLHGAYRMYYKEQQIPLSSQELLFRKMVTVMGEPRLYLTQAIKCSPIGETHIPSRNCLNLLNEELTDPVLAPLPRLYLGVYRWTELTFSHQGVKPVVLDVKVSDKSYSWVKIARYGQLVVITTTINQQDVEPLLIEDEDRFLHAFNFIWNQT